MIGRFAGLRFKTANSPGEKEPVARTVLEAFDADFYARQPNAPSGSPDQLVEHYLQIGWKSGLNPTAAFDTAYYLNENSDIRESGVNPFYHYLAHGRTEGRAAASSRQVPDLLARAFDREFYRQQLGQTSLKDEYLLAHYLEEGWRAGFNPNPLFDGAYYLVVNADVREAGAQPFSHFVRHGYFEGRRPSESAFAGLSDDLLEVHELAGRHFDALFYLEQSDGLPVRDTLNHFLSEGWKANLRPNRGFDPAYYLNNNEDVRSSGHNPFIHYLRWGRFEGRRPDVQKAELTSALEEARIFVAPHFDEEFYFSQNRAMLGENIDPLTHFIQIGWRLNLDPNPHFSTQFYLSHTPSLRPFGQNPFLHYLTEGRRAGRPPTRKPEVGIKTIEDAQSSAVGAPLIREFVDEDYYLSLYEDISQNRLDPTEHYFVHGWREGRDPSPFFSTNEYLERFAALRELGLNPLLHQQIWGGRAGGDELEPPPTYVESPTVLGRDLQCVARALRLPVPATRRPEHFDARRLQLHWVIPDFDIGGGGHMTIFRMVKWLETFGHESILWVHYPTYEWDDERRNEIVLGYFQAIRSRVRTLTPDARLGDCDALIATGWDTAYTVRHAPGHAARFYFVQDYEPQFYPVGSQYFLARETYRFDLGFICASRWLEQRVTQEQDGWARSFDLASDELYRPRQRALRSKALHRIAFYGREGTSRRAVELGFMAFERLKARGISFEVHVFGTNTCFSDQEYSVVNHGICAPDELASLYSDCDVGICFSGTNYSLVPQEMMACELPVVELDGESTRAAYPPGVALLSGPAPDGIAAAIEQLLLDSEFRMKQIRTASDWVSSISWEGSARKVECALTERLMMLGSRRVEHRAIPRGAPTLNHPVTASVLIPTLNGGTLLREVVERVLAQRFEGRHELILVDSESDDGSIETVRREFGEAVRIETVARTAFQHGRTRNLAASLSRGDFLVFLTQDAMPIDLQWLSSFVATMERYPEAAGGFGRHIAWPDSSPFTKRDIKEFFDAFLRHPLVMSKYTDFTRWSSRDIGYRQLLHYFSDNNSILRRTCWLRIPYPEIDYGEDQAWADEIINAGFCKVYAPLARVFHSHDFGPDELRERSRIEARFFSEVFGYNVAPSHPENTIRDQNVRDERWALRHRVDPPVIELQKKLNRNRVAGHLAGYADSLLRSRKLASGRFYPHYNSVYE